MGLFDNDSWHYQPHFSLHKDRNQVIESVVDYLESYLMARQKVLNPKPLGLATGRTMSPIYKLLVSRVLRWPSKDLKHLVYNWSSFNLDEYVFSPYIKENSFLYFMMNHIATPLGIDSKKMRIPDGLSIDPYKAASEYSETLREYGGISIQLLGLGNNGHIGFNEPPCLSNVRCRVVNLSEATREQNAFSFNHDPSKVPRKAITLGLKEILSSEEIHLIVIGKVKSKIFKSFIKDPCSPKLPASWLKLHNNLFVWADYEAAGDLM